MGHHICAVEFCEKPVLCKNYCRKHYNQQYRLGYVISEGNQNRPPLVKTDSSYYLRQLRREYQLAKEHYELIVGVEGRKRWRKVMNNLIAQAAKEGWSRRDLEQRQSRQQLVRSHATQ